MNPEEFLTLAEELAGNASEATLRSAASRAYYAVFHLVLEELGPLLKIPRDASAHRIVGRCLRNAGIAEAVTLGQTLDSLRDLRNTSDYRLDVASPSPATIAARVASARRFFDDYRALPRPQFVDGVRIYERSMGGF